MLKHMQQRGHVHTHTPKHMWPGDMYLQLYMIHFGIHIKCNNITCLFWFYPPFSGLLTIFDPSPHRSFHPLHRARNPAGKDWRIHWAAGAGRRKTDPAKESSMIKGYKGHTPNLTKVLIWVGGVTGSSILTFPRDIKIHQVMLAISHGAFTHVIPDINQKVFAKSKDGSQKPGALWEFINIID